MNLKSIIKSTGGLILYYPIYKFKIIQGMCIGEKPEAFTLPAVHLGEGTGSHPGCWRCSVFRSGRWVHKSLPEMI